MKKLVFINSIAIVVTMVFVVFLTNRNHQSFKLGYVNTVRLMSEYEGMIDVKQHIQYLQQKQQYTIDSISNELSIKIKYFEANSFNYPALKKEKESKEIENLQKKLYSFQQAASQKLMEEEQRRTREALAPIDAIINEYAETNSFTIIFSALPSGNIVYAKDGIDVTGDILKIVNNK